MTKVILDLDTGIDDAMALAYTLACPELEVIGVTGTYGNVDVATGVRNSLALLELLDRTDIPVFVGPGHPSDRDDFDVADISQFIHGSNGLGEVSLPEPRRQAETQGAVDFMVDSVRTYGEELIIIPTGPSTTIAAAIERDPTFADNAHLVMMGGALTVPGNVSEWAEANISQDPKASNYVFRHASDVTMVGLDVTLQTLLTKKETARWRDLGTASGAFFADATDYYINSYETTAPHLGGCGLHDPLAVAVAADPSLVGYVHTNLKVEVSGPTRGRTIGDEMRLREPNKRAHVAVDVDAQSFVSLFMDRLIRLFGEH